MNRHAPRVTEDLIAAVAEAAAADPRSVMKRLLGLPLRTRVQIRIDDELRQRGLQPGEPSVESIQDAA